MGKLVFVSPVREVTSQVIGGVELTPPSQRVGLLHD